MKKQNNGVANNNTLDENLTKDYIIEAPKKRRHRTKYKRKKRIKKVLLIILIVLLSISIVCVSAYFILNEIGKSEMLNDSKIDIKPPKEMKDEPIVEDKGRTIDYNGSTYKYNENLTNILLMGIDEDEMEITGELGGAGQADSIFLLSLDTNTSETKVLAISRDTMEDINIYTDSGKYVGVKNKQIALSFAYGNGKDTSCENMVTSVSRLMYGVPINSYFSFHVEAIPVLNNLVGGVSVQATSDFVLPDRTIYKGETITLYGDEAEPYVRGRDIYKAHSNAERMKRQINYVESFTKQSIELTRKDLSFPLTLYNTAYNYMYTNINISRVTYLASSFISKGNAGIDIQTIKGEIKQGEKYEEFYPDEEKLFEQMLDMFYYKVR